MVSKQTVTLANSIVGIGVLAMPFCFKQCGVLLASVLLIVGALVTRIVCYFLLKAGTITRRRNYEMLAWDTFGSGGKFVVEISLIGFLIGTLIAFMVVIGDLGPQIVSEIFQIQNNESLRTIIMAGLSLFVALPLGFQRTIDSLSMVSSLSVVFYIILVCKVLEEATGTLFNGDYLDEIYYWRPSGVLQCIPILSMALSCQTQIFGIYESLPDPSMPKMNSVVKQAVNICTILYFCVGFFGYIAFYKLPFGGNILMFFTESWSTQIIKGCFLMSVVFSIPLVVFPCRASLHSLIFRRVQMHHSLHDISTNYIPEGRLKLLTIVIIGATLICGILVPNIELVLGLVGSTTGSVICIIFPCIMFIRVTSKQTTERIFSQILFFMGVLTMVVSTYATLFAAEQAQPQYDQIVQQPQNQRVTETLKNLNLDSAKIGKASFEPIMQFKLPEEIKEQIKIAKQDLAPKNLEGDKNKPTKNRDTQPRNQLNDIKVDTKLQGAGEKDQVDKLLPNNQASSSQKPVKKESVSNDDTIRENLPPGDKNMQKLEDTVIEPKQVVPKSVVSKLPLKEPEKLPNQKDAAENFLKTLKEHEESQKKLLEEQRQILADLKEHHDHDQDVHRQNVVSDNMEPGDKIEGVRKPSENRISKNKLSENEEQDLKIRQNPPRVKSLTEDKVIPLNNFSFNAQKLNTNEQIKREEQQVLEMESKLEVVNFEPVVNKPAQEQEVKHIPEPLPIMRLKPELAPKVELPNVKLQKNLQDNPNIPVAPNNIVSVPSDKKELSRSSVVKPSDASKTKNMDRDI